MSSATTVPFVVIGSRPASRPMTGHRVAGRAPGHRVPSHRLATQQIYLRRRLVAGMLAATLTILLWLGGGVLLANRGGAPASTPAVRQPVAGAPADAAMQAVQATHVVAPGESLWLIAGRYRGDVSHTTYLNRLIRLNGGVTIDVGQIVVLP